MSQEILERILLELQGVSGRIDNLDKGQKDLTDRLDSLDKGQKDLTGRLDNLDKGQQSLVGRMDKLEIKLEEVVSDKVAILFDGYTQLKEQADRNHKELTGTISQNHKELSSFIENLWEKSSKNELEIIRLKHRTQVSLNKD